MGINVNIRLMKTKDKEFIIGLAERFYEFSLTSRRDKKKMIAAQKRIIDTILSNPSSTVFVAEQKNEEPIGFIHVTKMIDYFTGEPQGYISNLAICHGMERKGVSSLLIQEAEEWSKNQGFEQIVLNVFTKNIKAINLYEKLGFENDHKTMVKNLF